MAGDVRGRAVRRPCGLLLCLLVGFACTPEPRNQPLRVGLVVWPPFELGYLAQELALIPDGAVRIVDYESPAEAMRAYRYGLVDVVGLTTVLALELAAQDPDHRIVFVVNVSCGGDALVAAPSIGSVAELRGKRLGVESTIMGALVTDRSLASAGLVRSDVELVSVDVPDQLDAFTRGTVDAVATYTPTSARLIAGGAVELWNTSATSGELVDVLVTRKAVVEARAGELDALIEGWLIAFDRLETDRTNAIRRMARRERSTPTEFARNLEVTCPTGRPDNLRLLGGDAPALEQPTLRLASWMIESGFISKTPDLDLFFEPRFVAPGPP